MSTASSNTPVTWQKPFREIDRVCSSPGMPASAVSSGNVTNLSMSVVENAGCSTVICTCLLVMSGTASIGNCDNDHAPNNAATIVNATTQ